MFCQFGTFRCTRNALKLSVCVLMYVWLYVCACVFVCLSPTCSELIWFDWFASFFYVSSPQTIGHLALWLFCFIRKQIREVQLRMCVCVHVCSCLSLIRVPFFLYMRKVFKAFASEYFFVSFTIVCWMFIELAIALRDCFFSKHESVFLFRPHTNWIINTPPFCIFSIRNSFPKSNTNAINATATKSLINAFLLKRSFNFKSEKNFTLWFIVVCFACQFPGNFSD